MSDLTMTISYIEPIYEVEFNKEQEREIEDALNRWLKIYVYLTVNLVLYNKRKSLMTKDLIFVPEFDEEIHHFMPAHEMKRLLTVYSDPYFPKLKIRTDSAELFSRHFDAFINEYMEFFQMNMKFDMDEYIKEHNENFIPNIIFTQEKFNIPGIKDKDKTSIINYIHQVGAGLVSVSKLLTKKLTLSPRELEASVKILFPSDLIEPALEAAEQGIKEMIIEKVDKHNITYPFNQSAVKRFIKQHFKRAGKKSVIYLGSILSKMTSDIINKFPNISVDENYYILGVRTKYFVSS